MSQTHQNLRDECPFRICEDKQKSDPRTSYEKYDESLNSIPRACPLCPLKK
jgi:hypothetical protein